MAGRDTPALAEAAVEAGADIIEVGFPFSDPLAERARAATDLPLYAGFGISTPAHAQAAAALVDGIAVGSRAVEVAEEGPLALSEYVGSLRDALDRAGAAV